jgi:uronate dehydrogenase
MAIHNRILITGAAGALGAQLRRHGPILAERVVLSDRTPIDALAPHEEFRTADLANLAETELAVAGCDAVVHLGGQGLEAAFATILESNIVGTYNLYEAARRQGVKRVVYASSIHAVGYYERTQTIDASVPTRPDSLYGVSKTFGENLSRYYFDKFGIESVCLRIGSCFPKPTIERHLITWLSYRDLRQIVELALIAPRVGHMISMPTSRNRASFWDDRAAASLGFQPVDSADDYRDAVMAEAGPVDANDPAIRFQGGSFCAAGHFEDPS